MTEREIAELKVAYSDVANRHNAVATALARLVVEVSYVNDGVVNSVAFAAACDLLGYPDYSKIHQAVIKELLSIPCEDRKDWRDAIVNEILAGTYLNGDDENEPRRPDN